MALVVYGQCLWLRIYGYVYGCVFMAMCLWVCMDVFLDVWMCFWLWVRGYVYGYRVSILREVQFIKYRGLPLLGACFHFHNFWISLLHEAHFHNPWDLLLHEAHFSNFWGLTPPRGPFPQFSLNFSTFPPSKMEKFAPVCSVE